MSTGTAMRDRLGAWSRDPLTGLPVRPRFERDLDRACRRPAGRVPTWVGVLYLDVDGLKRVNDRDGHSAGDAVLAAVAHQLTRELPREVRAARLAGDEFAVLLPAMTSPDEAGHLAARLLRATARVASLSIGVATAPVGAATPKEVCERADAALLAAKRDGGAQVTVRLARGTATIQDPVDASPRRCPSTQVDPTSVPRSRRRLLAQPVLDVATGRVVRVETLLRVAGTDGSLRTPVGEVRRAQASGRLDEVTSWVLEQSLDAHRTSAEAPAVPVSVNIAAAQVVEPTVVRGVLTALRERGLPGGCLVLEIHTDGCAPVGFGAAVQVLRRHGVGLVLEDVDEAWALRDIAAHRPHEVTLSRALVQGLPDDPVARAVLQGVAAVARGVGASVTAKGVETPAQWDRVVTSGCDRAQGRELAPERALADVQMTTPSVWRTTHLTMRDVPTPVLTGDRPVGTVHPCTPAFSYAERAFAENQRPRDPSSPAGPGGFLCPRGHFDAAEES